MTNKYMITCQMQDGSATSPLPGGATLRHADVSAVRILGDLTMEGCRNDLARLEVRVRHGSVAAIYAGDPDQNDGSCGFEVRGVTSGRGHDNRSVKIGEYPFLQDAEAALDLMEQAAHRWRDYRHIYVCPAIDPQHDVDGFDPEDSAAFNEWYVDTISRREAPYLIIIRPRHGICRHPDRFSEFDRAFDAFRELHEDPLRGLHGLERCVLFVDGLDGTIIDSFEVLERIEELQEGMGESHAPGDITDCWRQGCCVVSQGRPRPSQNANERKMRRNG